MSAKHTPGPWLRDGTLVYALGWKRASTGRIAEVNRFSASVSGGYVEDGRTEPSEIEANAALIAAAPALADALEAALHEAGHACCCEKPHSTVGLALHEADCWTAKARAALRAAGRLP